MVNHTELIDILRVKGINAQDLARYQDRDAG